MKNLKTIVETEKRPIIPITEQVKALVYYTFITSKGKPFTAQDVIKSLDECNYVFWKSNMETMPEKTVHGLLSTEVSNGSEKPLKLPYLQREYVLVNSRNTKGKATYSFMNSIEAKETLLQDIEHFFNLLGSVVEITYDKNPYSNELELTIESMNNYEGLPRNKPMYYLQDAVLDELARYYHAHKGYFETFIPQGLIV